MIGGIEIHSSPLVPSHVPNITFDPKRKCTWATPEFRASTDKWLLDRFGSHAVAFVFNPRALLGLGFGGPMAVLHPMHAAGENSPYKRSWEVELALLGFTIIATYVHRDTDAPTPQHCEDPAYASASSGC